MLSSACALVVLLTIGALARPDLRAELGVGTARASFIAGQSVHLPASAYSSADRTLILFARADCAACRRAQAFLKSVISDAAKAGGPRVTVIMDSASAEDRKRALAYVEGLGLESAQLLGVDITTTRVKTVPSLVLVDRHGVVQAGWEPPLPQDEIHRALAAMPLGR